MIITVKGVKYSIGYALWKLYKLKGETDQQFLDRAIGIDDALRERDRKRAERIS